MVTMIKPCLGCGASTSSDFREYHGVLGCEAIICLKCGMYCDAHGTHKAVDDENSALYVQVDRAALAKRKRQRDHAHELHGACKEALHALNEIKNTKLRGKFDYSYALASHLSTVLSKVEGT